MSKRDPEQGTKDRLGAKFYNWTVIGKDLDNWQPKKRRWLCQCVCGNVKSISAHCISGVLGPRKTPSLAESCGCKGFRRSTARVLTGEVFGTRTVGEFSHKDSRGMHYWHFECQCGNRGKVSSQNLKRTNTCKKCHSTYTIGFGNPEPIKYPDMPRYLYLCNHPTRRDEYKVGIGKNPNYRTSPCHGGLVLLDAVRSTSKQVIEAEAEILKRTFKTAVTPEDMKDGVTEWRKGEECVRVWHEVASNLKAID